MQFRTNSGGLEIGSVTIGASGLLSLSRYWPFGATNGSNSAFSTSSRPLPSVVADSSGTFLTAGDDGGRDYIFGTANGQFLVDTPNGAILGLAKAAGKAFDPANAGTYTAMLYEKNDVMTSVGNVESRTGTLATDSITLDSSGNMTARDSSGATVASGMLTPVADASYLVGPNELADPCFGLFTVRLSTPTSQKDIFVAFQGRAMLFSTFTSAVPASQGAGYSYSYGVGLH